MKDFPVGLCWGTIHRASLAETIELAGRHGFPTIAVSPHIHADSIADGLSEQALRRHLQDAGVSVRVIDCIAAGLPGMPPGDTKFGGRTIAQADAETCFRVAEALEAPVVNISLYNSEVVPVAEMAEAVGAICRQAATRGMAIAIPSPKKRDSRYGPPAKMQQPSAASLCSQKLSCMPSPKCASASPDLSA